MIDCLAAPMSGDGCRAEPFGEQYRERLKAACAEDRDIWDLWVTDFGPGGFDESIDAYLSNPSNRTFVVFEGDELAGMSSFLRIEESRQALEIGGTYYCPMFRGTGLNRRIKDMMLRRAFDCGFRRVEFGVDSRNKRSQAHGEVGRGARRCASRLPSHLDRTRPRHGAVLHPEGRVAGLTVRKRTKMSADERRNCGPRRRCILEVRGANFA